METGKLRTLLFLMMNVFILWTLSCSHGQSTEQVIDLLAALNMSQPIKGISKIHSEDPSGTTKTFRLRPSAPHLTLPPEFSRLLGSSGPVSLGVHLVGRQAPDSCATLLSISSGSSPLLRVVSSTTNHSLRLDYQAVGVPGLHGLLFPGGNPFSGAHWVRLALGLEPDKVSLFVDCEEAVVLPRGGEESLHLSQLPPDLAVTLASSAGDNDSKFTGYLKTAEIAINPHRRRPWDCPDRTDGPAAHPTRGSGLDLLDLLHHKGQQELQKDQPPRGVALGPPGAQQGGRLSSPTTQEGKRLSALEQTLQHMNVMLDMLKAQNMDLQSRVHDLEGCECVRRRTCTWEGREVEEGRRWQTHSNSVCSCSSGQVTCEASAVGCDVDGVQQNVTTADGCVTCTCRSGQRDCSPVSCPPLRCSQTHSLPGECCKRCKGCGVNGHDFPDGAQIHTGDQCQTCTCVKGNMECSPLPCPPLTCVSPLYRHGDCCPHCAQCEHESQLYLEGEDVPSSHPCLRCRCSAGAVTCESQEAACPTAPCSHPAAPRGQCCPHCEQCEYDRSLYADGQLFQPPGSGPCLQCRCKGGNVVCHTERCPPAQCSHPIKDPQHCCPICKGCVWEGQQYEEGARWQTEGSCSSCSCVNGETVCAHTQCPPAECLHPTTNPGSCCAVCESCTYNHRIYGNGQRFTTPDQPCHICTCQYGSVQCLQRPCTPLNCTNTHTPPGECCPKCPDCSFENHVFLDGEVFPSPANACEKCVCADGRVDCRSHQCPRPNCNAPVPGTCCQNNCNGCSYAGKDYPNGQELPHPTDKCRTCSCINGNIQCLMKRCPPLQCSNPSLLPGECCPQCPEPPADCAFEQSRYRHTQRFHHPTDSCRSCLCTNGTVRCQRKPCLSATCSHPITQDCCPTCEGCLYERREWANGARWDPVSDPCAVCTCEDGSVRCVREPCPAPACRHPVQRKCCKSCEGCLFNGQEYPDRYEFVDETDRCRVCSCFSGDIVCSRLPCNNPCRHPYSPAGQCCGECDRCSYNNVVLIDSQSIPDPSDPCSECTCQRGSVECVKKHCPPAVCSSPTTNACGCPVCEGCLYQGMNYLDGHVVSGATEVCQDCTCSSGEVVCVHRRCPSVLCPHPAVDGCACPVCDGCRFSGRECSHEESFPHPSQPCQRCTCLQGSVTCVSISCPPAPCPRPLTPPGQCCPRCTACVLDGREYHNGQQWAQDSPPCSTCTCQEGEVHCVSQECPKMPCVHQVQEAGACCPRCRGCMYDGLEHPEGSSWFPDASACTSCMCVGGVTTCSEIRCLSPCTNTVRLPGECCPVCADCLFEGRVYSPTDSFHPADDPCQVCTCELMPDGGQHLSCYRKQCPSLVDCPPSNILSSGPHACCPVCAQPLSNCTATLIGNEVLATDDPCFTCQCKDLTWTCLHQNCPPLPCPVSERVAQPDSCCPVCNGCEIEGQNARVSSGSSWTDSDDDCVTCTCNLGHIECSIEECAPLVCQEEQVPMKTPGKCCYECQAAGVSCTYQGALYQSSERWSEDECTSCTCVSGEVHCGTERCPALLCSATETRAVVPGVCCPRCLPRPATCVAFGDPHYRTFDGRMLHFQGACTYVLTQDCRDGDFRIHVTNDDRGRKGVSWTKEVTVFLGELSVQLLQDWVVKVDDQVVALPFLREPFLFVERQTNTILLNTNLGIKVLWSGRSHLEVSVPGSYRKHTCGLCGDFNDFPQDDLRMPSGRISQSEASFGNSWQVLSGSSALSSCRPGKDLDPCRAAGYQARKGANGRCKVLKSAVFRPCHGAVPPEPWHAACVYDLCACGPNADECLCDALEAYAGRCRDAGLVLRWRSPALCAVGCPAERGFVFDECGPPCPVTCLNADVPLGLIERHCFKPCVPGCQCPAGLVLHNHYCIPADQCPKIIHGNSSTLQGSGEPPAQPSAHRLV